MAKVHPQASVSDPCSMGSAGRETFTIWMKSLVCHTNGCTVFDSEGEIVYRVENYDSKGSSEVHLMDLRGKVLFTILKKKLQLFGCWNGHRGNFTGTKKEKPCFQVKKYWRIPRRDLAYQVTMGLNKYWIVSLGRNKQGFKIVNIAGDIVAEVKQKQLSSGVVLGDDVLTLEVEPYIDHSLIVALVTVYGLINRRL
ncbi:PREDICTED: protein LURP-one-related 4 [Theobroma cacao]|uniref:Protein LURP-one-related 4 n=1 Tax=Theobroma cacao TaxID=3641 RepID=A0AB32VHB6_THECC|nr:PREDICTED: protein LURP-one-related 4 [Theobroma cacao]